MISRQNLKQARNSISAYLNTTGLSRISALSFYNRAYSATREVAMAISKRWLASAVGNKNLFNRREGDDLGVRLSRLKLTAYRSMNEQRYIWLPAFLIGGNLLQCKLIGRYVYLGFSRKLARPSLPERPLFSRLDL